LDSLPKHYFEAKDFSNTIKNLNFIQKNELEVEKFYLLAQSYSASGKINSAILNYQKIIQNKSANSRKLIFLEKLLEIQKKSGKMSEYAETLFIKYREFPKFLKENEREYLISTYLEAQQFQAVEKLLQNFNVEILTDDIVLTKELNLVSENKLINLAKYYFYLANYEKSAEYYLKYLKIASNPSRFNEIYANLGQIFISQGKKRLALDYFKKVNSSHEKYYDVLKKITFLSFEFNEFADVISYSKVLIPETEKSSPIYRPLKLNLLISEVKQNSTVNFDKAYKNYQEKFPKDKEGAAQLLFERAKQLRAKKKYTKSNRVLNDLIDDFDETTWVDDASYYKILNYLAVNNLEKAMDGFNDFFDDFKNSDLLSEIHLRLGQVYERANQPEKAIGAYKKSLEQATTDDEKRLTYAHIIEIYKRVGLWEAVLTTASTYLNLFPNSENQFKFKLLIGQSYAYLQRGAEGISYLKALKYEADRETEPEIQFYIADTYYKMGEYETAVSEYIKIPLLSKKTKLQWIPSALYYAGQCYEKLGKKSEALKMYSEIVKRPGIDALFKKEAKKQIKRLEGRD
jgi:tetratricopeptide (TPR) repeat protein